MINNLKAFCGEHNVADKLVFSIIRQKLYNTKKNKVLDLQVGNKRTKIIWNVKQGKLAVADIQDFGFRSKRYRLKSLKKIRKIYGRRSVELKLEESIKKEEDDFKDLISSTTLTMKKIRKKVVTFSRTTAVYVNDIPKLIKLAAEKRNIKNYFVKLGLDGGQNSFKIVLSIIDEDKLDDFDEKSDSVKHVFILFIAFGMTENRFNLRLAWTILGLDKLQYDAGPFLILVDLKVANLLLGLMNHASKYPCSWCLACKVDGKIYDESAELRTINHIFQMAKKAKNINIKDDESDEDESYDGINSEITYGVVDSPICDLVNKDEDELVLFKIRPPQLHLLLGLANLIRKQLEKCNESVCIAYLRTCGITNKVNNRTKELNGNGSRKFVKKYSVL